MIYFAQSGSDGLIKIGLTNNISKRLGALQTGSAQTITILGVADGSRADERALHEQFSKYRRIGEWFEPHDELLAHIKNHAATYLVVAKNDTKRLVDELGGTCAVANLFDVGFSTVSEWIASDSIPHRHRPLMLLLTERRGLTPTKQLQDLSNMLRTSECIPNQAVS